MRRFGPFEAVLAVVPALAVAAALLVDPSVEQDAVDRAPTSAPLSRATLVCPSAEADGRALVGSDAGAGGRGRVEVDERGSRPDRVQVGDGATAEVTSDAAVAVTGTGTRAAGLAAYRVAGPGLRAVACPATSSDQWFTGVGAGAEHASVLELHNPDAGPATATVTVLGQSGPVGAGGNLRGVSVPGGGTLRLDLADEIPKREELALRVTTERGRLAATVVDGFDPVGRGAATREYLPGQAAPVERSLLLGLPEPLDGLEEPVVVVANPGDSVARVQLRLVTPTATFAPEDLREETVDPGSVRRFSISRLLGSQAAEGALGIEVVGSLPVTSSFRARSEGDLVTLVPGGEVEQPTVAQLPAGLDQRGGARLVLGGATGLGTVRVESWDERGRPLEPVTVEVGPETAAAVDVPAGARQLRVVPDRTPVAGAVVLRSGAGVASVALRELVREALVPDVRPALGQSSG